MQCENQESSHYKTLANLSLSCVVLRNGIPGDAKAEADCAHFSKNYVYDYKVESMEEGNEGTVLDEITDVSQATCAKRCTEWSSPTSVSSISLFPSFLCRITLMSVFNPNGNTIQRCRPAFRSTIAIQTPTPEDSGTQTAGMEEANACSELKL